MEKKVINGKNYLECDLIMLNTTEDSFLFIGDLSKQLHFNYSIEKGNSSNQHLYILSNEEIKSGDFFYYKHFGEDIISQAEATADFSSLNNLDKYFKKIIATTNDNLVIKNNTILAKILPQIPQEFIEHYIHEYNKGNVIDKVLIEVEMLLGDEGIIAYAFKENDYKIKLNKKNEVSILIREETIVIGKGNSGTPKQEKLEKTAKEYYPLESQLLERIAFKRGFTECSEQMFSREEVEKICLNVVLDYTSKGYSKPISDWIKENLK